MQLLGRPTARRPAHCQAARSAGAAGGLRRGGGDTGPRLDPGQRRGNQRPCARNSARRAGSVATGAVSAHADAV